MGEVITIGLDIAKSVFQVHGVDVDGAVVIRKRVSRAKLSALAKFAKRIKQRHNGTGDRRMIELVSETRCTQCNLCVQVCPVNAFDAVPDAVPKIARQVDCQTCSMCELYCPVDALYVAPDAEHAITVDEFAVEGGGLLGSYREAVGWTGGGRAKRSADMSFKLLSSA
jgi:NAD-dependent dihydropyrimidine dehydrogenase PreA subunit